MVLGERGGYFRLRMGPNSALREGQKIPCLMLDHTCWYVKKLMLGMPKIFSAVRQVRQSHIYLSTAYLRSDVRKPKNYL